MTSRSWRGVVRHATRNGASPTPTLDSPPGASYYPSVAHRQNPKFPLSTRTISHPGVFPAAQANGVEAQVDIAELKRKSVAELHAMAESLNITNYSGLRKQDSFSASSSHSSIPTPCSA